jgi:hypothetical protein
MLIFSRNHPLICSCNIVNIYCLTQSQSSSSLIHPKQNDIDSDDSDSDSSLIVLKQKSKYKENNVLKVLTFKREASLM